MKNFLEKVEKQGPAGRERPDRKGKKTSRRTREELAKWNPMTALRFQTGGRQQAGSGTPNSLLLTGISGYSLTC